ncbi:uncharacterized protein BT62DRAFT_740606 [Guyanagaster necrorhizus]|uniref:Uncharacterized protein n=1 Tax=Guyanagaster necrorhizus TaxID=856835 RepID=A0A9P7VEW5_9AGAR|nr:uncharacterized protein BT62DRAFT_740606 [Guyanagaster necrorhizus MCA 3950]KAG7439322.1 hypothetical protein BT62DRAFT_740606 [Guyanagaster necrorhizus MCA 3950]
MNLATTLDHAHAIKLYFVSKKGSSPTGSSHSSGFSPFHVPFIVCFSPSVVVSIRVVRPEQRQCRTLFLGGSVLLPS